MTEKHDPETIARLVAKAEREGVPCVNCGWAHLPTTKCLTAKAVKQAEVIREGDPVEKWKALAERAAQHPTVYQRTGRKCPGCQGDIWSGQNFLGVWFDVIGEDREYLDEHQAVCCKPVVKEPEMELQRPPRPRQEDDEWYR